MCRSHTPSSIGHHGRHLGVGNDASPIHVFPALVSACGGGEDSERPMASQAVIYRHLNDVQMMPDPENAELGSWILGIAIPSVF